MANQEDTMAKFLTDLRQECQNKADHSATPAEVKQAAEDLAVIEYFEAAEEGRTQREADADYCASLDAIYNQCLALPGAKHGLE